MPKPLAIDLFCGLGGWAEGFLAEGYDVIGFDVEARPYPAQLVLQDVLTLHGSQFRNAAAIVASPPCTEYSYMAMPWQRGKQIARALRGQGEFPKDYNGSRTIERLNVLFDACFRIQREASEAACREIPMVVENVKGAQPWVGSARAHFRSFYLWGDINSVGGSIVAGRLQFGNVLRPGKRGTGGKQNPDGTENGQGSWFKIADSKNRGSKNNGGSWFNEAHNTESGHGQNPDGRKVPELGSDRGTHFRKTGQVTPHFANPAEHGTKVTGDWFGSYADMKAAGTISPGRLHGKGSPKRAQAAAEIAMIPPPLARHIARVFYPTPAADERTSHLKPAD